MSGSVPITANEFIEQQISERLVALERAFNADAFCMVGTIFTTCLREGGRRYRKP